MKTKNTLKNRKPGLLRFITSMVISCMFIAAAQGQPFTVSTYSGTTNFSAVTPCNEGWTFSFDSDGSWGCTIYVLDNDTKVLGGSGSLGTLTGLGFADMGWGNGAIGTNNGTNQNTTIYCLLTKTAGKVSMEFSTTPPFCGPTILVPAPASMQLQNFKACYNENSAPQTFKFHAGALEDDVVITAPAGYEISKDNITYSTSLSYVPEAGNEIASKTVYVRLESGGTPGTPVQGAITLNTLNSTTGEKTIDLDGEIGTAQLTNPKSDIYVTSPASAEFVSSSSNFVVQGTCIPVNIAVSAEFEISLTESGSYSATLTDVAHGTKVWVRTKAGAEGEKTGTIQFFDTYGAKPLIKEFAVKGKVQAPEVTFDRTSVRFNKTCIKTASEAEEIELTAVCYSAGVELEVSNSYFEISAAEYGTYSKTLSLNFPSPNSKVSVWVRTTAAAPAGATAGILTATVMGKPTAISLSAHVSTGEITVKENPFYVGAYVQGSGPSALQTLIVENDGCLNAAAVAVAVNGTEFSANKTSIPSSGTQTINLQLAAGLSTGNYESTLTLTAVATDGVTPVKLVVPITGRVISTACTALAESAVKAKIKVAAGFDSKINAKEYGAHMGEEITITSDGFVPPSCYSMVLEKRSLDIFADWEPFMTSLTPVFTFVPDNSAAYRIRYRNDITGVSVVTTDVLVRVTFACNCDNTEQIFSDDFGSFADSRTYVDGEGNSYSNAIGTKIIADYAAPDPYDNVKNHYYRFDDIQGLRDGEMYSLSGVQNLEDWCAVKLSVNSPSTGKKFTKRIVDGTYALITNPNDFDNNMGDRDYVGNDYWSGTDHTGNHNGAMLFVNVMDYGLDMVVYERDIILDDCPALQNGANVVFSTWINRATVASSFADGKTPIMNGYRMLDDLSWWVDNEDRVKVPVNVRLEVFDMVSGMIVASIPSGDLQFRNEDAGSNGWVNLSYKFPATSGRYTIRIINNNPGGILAGNDILLDDISVTVCYPQIQLDTSRVLLAAEKLHRECSNKGSVNLIAMSADPNENIKQYVAAPWYMFQYRKAGSGGAWTTYDGITQADQIELVLDAANPTFIGETEWRAVFAERPEIFADIVSGALLGPTCSNLFSISNPFNIVFTPNPNKDITLTGCIGDFKDFALVVPEDADGLYTWELTAGGKTYRSNTPNPDWTYSTGKVTFAAADKNSEGDSPFKIGKSAQTYIFTTSPIIPDPDPRSCTPFVNTIIYAKSTEGCEQTCEHNFSAWQTTTPATCDAAGEKTRTCSLCDEIETQAIAQLTEGCGEQACEHNFGEWQTTTPATCNAAGEKNRTCSLCDEVETQAIAQLTEGCDEQVCEHDFSAWQTTTPATCDAAGEKTRTCSLCDEIETQVIAQLTEGCGEQVCEHIFGEWQTTTPATCDAAGEKTRTCSLCDEVENQSIAQLTEGCGEQVCEHNFGEWQTTTPATCDAAGEKTRTCSLCDEVETQAIAQLTEGCDEQVCEHNFGEWQTTTPATCDAAGEKTRTCSLCDEVETQVIAQLTEGCGEQVCEHNFGEWQTTTPATCDAAGEKTRTCSLCDEVETQAIARLTEGCGEQACEHNFGEWQITTPATCNAAGEKTRTCSLCDEVETQVIARLTEGCGQAPTANFEVVGNRSACEMLIVTFTNKSTGATSYRWDFGDESAASTVQNPTKAYTKPGVYSVTLTAMNASGSNAKTITNYITVYADPKPSFTISPTLGCAPVAVDFRNTSTTSADITKSEWNFGDGSVEESTAITIAHTYNNPNVYSVSLTMTDANGCTATTSQPSSISVYALPVPNFTVSPSTTCDVPATVAFTSTTAGRIESYTWDFGDGSTQKSTTPTISHEYASEGAKSVTLAVTDGNGCVGKTTKAGVVDIANFETNFTAPDNVCINTSLTLTSAFNGQSGYTNVWFINDVQHSTAGSFSYTFPAEGTYTVKLRTTQTSTSCVREVEKQVIAQLTEGCGDQTCEHNFEWTVISPATCNAAGVKAEMCSKCNAYGAIQAIAQLTEGCGDQTCEHNFEWTVISPATCNAAGVKAEMCSKCNAYGAIQAIAQLTEGCGDQTCEHNFEWTVISPATCNAAGVKAEMCSKCNVYGTIQAIAQLTEGCQKYKVRVFNGICDKLAYTEGETVTISANVTVEGKAFRQWSSFYVTFADEYEATTTFIMPAQDVVVTAEFGTVGIETIAEQAVKIYPNPVKDELKIENGELRIENVEITDLTGSALLFPSFGRVGGGFSVNVSTLVPGVYFIKIETDKGIVTRKFVKE